MEQKEHSLGGGQWTGGPVPALPLTSYVIQRGSHFLSLSLSVHTCKMGTAYLPRDVGRSRGAIAQSWEEDLTLLCLNLWAEALIWTWGSAETVIC